MKRRHLVLAVPAAALAACARGGYAAGSVTPLKSLPARGATPPPEPALQLPTPAAPRADGRLTLIWFRDFE